MRTAKHLRYTISLIALFLAGSLRAQETKSDTVPMSTIELIFLRIHAADAKARRSDKYNGPTLEDKAIRMGLEVQDISILDDAAMTFAEKEAKLHEDVMHYEAEQEARKAPLDPNVFKSFGDRRMALVVEAFNSIRSGLSKQSFEKLVGLLDTELRESIKPIPFGR